MERRYRRNKLVLKSIPLLFTGVLMSSNSFSGVCNSSGPTYYICSGPAAPTDSTQNIAVFNPINIGTTVGFGINTLGGNAFTLEATGGISFLDDDSSQVAGGQNGILAMNNSSGDLSISSNGSISAGTGIGLWLDNRAGTEDLLVNVVDVAGNDDGINANHSGNGQVKIISTGTVTGTGDKGILVTTSSNGTDLTISAHQVSGGQEGISATNNGSGFLSVSADGSVSAGTGTGVWLTNSANGTDLSVSLTDVTAGGNAVIATNNGSGSLSVSTSGVLNAGNEGIYISNSGSGKTAVSANNITAGTNGIVAINAGSSSMSITTREAVIAGTGRGIWADNRASGTDLIINAANISANLNGIDANHSGSGQLSIITTGTVTGTAWYGINANNLGNGGATEISVGSESVVQGGVAGIYLASASSSSSSINIYGQVRSTSGLTTDNAILVSGSSVTVNFMESSLTTGGVNLTTGNDSVNLFGSLNGSVLMGDGDDRFVQYGSSNLSGSVDGGAGTDVLAFNNMGTVDAGTLGTTYLNFENLEITGGSNSLTGNWDFSTGTATFNGGLLSVNGHLLASQVNVGQNGILGGSGTISSDVVNYGTIAPGNSIGTLTVNGSVSFMEGSTYAVELGRTGSSDLLKVNGPVTISGGTVSANLARALYQDGQKWTIIEASDGIEGKFSSIRTNFTSETIRLVQRSSGDSYSLVLVRTPYATFGQTPNQTAVGAALDSILPMASGPMADMMIAMDFDMNKSQLSTTLQGLSPEMYTVFPKAGLHSVDVINQSVSMYQKGVSSLSTFADEQEISTLWNVWGRGLGGRLERDRDVDNEGYEYTTSGAVFGFDRTFGQESRAGVILGYSDTSLDIDDSVSNGQITGKHIGVYGSTRFDGLYFDGRAVYSSLDNSSQRYIATPAFTVISDGSFDSDVLSGSATGGYDFTFDSVSFGPVASIGYAYLDQEGFSESGSAFSVKAEETDTESLYFRLGMKFAGLFNQGQFRILPHGELGWLHEFKDDATTLTSSFADYPTVSFDVEGDESISDQLMFSLGVTVEYGSSLNFYGEYSLVHASEQQAHLFSCGLTWKF